jgi:hypothetical protein
MQLDLYVFFVTAYNGLIMERADQRIWMRYSNATLY